MSLLPVVLRNEISLLDIIESPPVDVVDDCFKKDSIFVTTVFAQTFSPEEAIYLPKALRWMRVPLMILLLLLSLCLVVLYPMSFGSTQMWLIFSVVLSMQLRDSLCQRMGRLCLDGRMEQTTFLCLQSIFQA